MTTIQNISWDVWRSSKDTLGKLGKRMKNLKLLIEWLSQWRIVSKKRIIDLEKNIKLLELIQQKNTLSIKELSNHILTMEKNLKEKNEEEQLENYWNNKRKKVNKSHKARNGLVMDLRCFFQRNFNLTKFTGTNDEKAKKALGYVISMIKYKRDYGEFWQYAYETVKLRTGDCEDMGILVANILWNNEVPYWRIRLVKGWVDYRGDKSYHVWCTYLAENNEWYVLDGAYWPRESTGLKLKWKNAEKYLDVDASWNSKYSFGGLKK